MTYICSGNGKTYEGKPWMTLNMNRWDNIPGPVKLSSYLTYKQSLDKIPKKHFNLIENKEDFNHITPHSKLPIQDDFIVLTETEINQLTNEQYAQYKIDYEVESLLEEELNSEDDLFIEDDY